jgi:hypothetical protein
MKGKIIQTPGRRLAGMDARRSAGLFFGSNAKLPLRSSARLCRCNGSYVYELTVDAFMTLP